MDPPPSGSTLTAEQRDRIAQNKKRAQELRNRKRQAESQSHFVKSTMGPPQSKRATSFAPFPTLKSLHANNNGSSCSSPSHSDKRSYLTPASAPSSVPANHFSKPTQPKAGHSTQSRFQSSSATPPGNARTHQPNLPCPDGSSSSADLTSKSSGNLGQVHTLKDVIVANFVILSRSRFKVQMAYDAGVIEIFKKMKTRSYGMRLAHTLKFCMT